MEAQSAPSQRKCVTCGRDMPMDANVCPTCGHDYRQPAMMSPVKHEKGIVSVVGGILILIAGIMGLAMGGIFLVIDVDDLDQLGVDVTGMLDFIEDLLTVCGAVFIILGLIAVLGGIFGVMRKHWGLAILGGVLGLFVIGPLFLGSILALIGLILVAVSRKDFE
jgi:hypothetical protein